MALKNVRKRLERIAKEADENYSVADLLNLAGAITELVDDVQKLEERIDNLERTSKG